MRVLLSLALGVLLCAVATGCAGLHGGPPDAKPEPYATKADFQRARDTAGIPLYWFGPKVWNLRARGVGIHKTSGWVGYGDQLCDGPSGCTWLASVGTHLERYPPDAALTRGERLDRCWHHVGRAVAWGCGTKPMDFTLWTGKVEVSTETLPAPLALRHVQPMNRTARQVGFAPPARFTCAELRESYPSLRSAPYRRLRASLPAELKPRGC